MHRPFKPIMLLTAALLVTGCHENPLKGHRTRTNVDALLNAATKAERKLGLDRELAGRVFLDCMEEKAANVNCADFFNLMLSFVQKEPGFEGMRPGDLTDRTQFKRLAESYDERWFNRADYDE